MPNTKRNPSIRTTPEGMAERILFNIKNRIEYYATITNNRTTLQTMGCQFWIDNKNFPAHELFCISKFQNDILKEGLDENINPKFKRAKFNQSIKYYKFRPTLKAGEVFKDCLEIDLKSAYWNMARKLGLINDELWKRSMPIEWDEALNKKLITKRQYDLCKSITRQEALEKGIIKKPTYKLINGISKKTRLASIGSLAKTTVKKYFDGYRSVEYYRYQNPLHYLWNAIAYETALLMNRAARKAGDDFIFYWTDALIIKCQSKDKVINFLKDEGFDITIYKIQKVEIVEGRILVHSNDPEKNPIRPFSTKSKKK